MAEPTDEGLEQEAQGHPEQVEEAEVQDKEKQEQEIWLHLKDPDYKRGKRWEHLF